MGRLALDYSRGKIYKIVVDTDEEYDVYVGSTAQPLLSSRMTKHRTGYRKWLNGEKTYFSSFKLFERFGLDKCKIVLIENYPCNSVDELTSRERYWFETLKNCNIRKPYLGEEERAKETQKIYSHSHYEKNKEKRLEQCRQYREQNTEKIRERCRLYYEKTKEKKELRASEKICCVICQKMLRRDSMCKHKKKCHVTET
jgi:hypothetical protein